VNSAASRNSSARKRINAQAARSTSTLAGCGISTMRRGGIRGGGENWPLRYVAYLAAYPAGVVQRSAKYPAAVTGAGWRNCIFGWRWPKSRVVTAWRPWRVSGRGGGW